MRTGGNGARSFGLLAMSISGHIIVFSMLGLVPPPSEVLAMREAQFEVIEPPPEPEAPPPPEPEPPEPEPEPEKKQAPKPAAPEPEPEPEPTEEPPPEPAEEVADFTGVTLTAEGAGAGWSTVVGSGAPLKGPVGKIGRKQGTATETPAAKVVTGPKVVSAKSLKQRPVPPAGLNEALQRNYPDRARMQGIEGDVIVSLRIMPDGRPAMVRTTRESPQGYGFAEACRKTLMQRGAWDAPRSHNGEPVATDIKFTCEFAVDY